MIAVRVLKVEETKNIAALHQMAFDNFFLTSLGTKFLGEFYGSIIKSKDGVAIGAYNEKNELVGFAIGARVKKGFYKNILKNNFISLSYTASTSLIKKPEKIIRLIKSFLTTETSNDNFLNYASLLSICVDPEKKGQKIGKHLLLAFESEVIKFSDGITLTTDKLNNDYVNHFYFSNNYILTDHFNQGDRPMNFYVKKLK
ncbi:GNAT family N-acetyltransferase [Flavobacterium sp. FBOR7N2.3]|uniref:GNAT family N-acetyltransferase n=1 Tax=Flavobacterium magnesitis TaxID=3138077 RepID=A0ABV4TII3_9FLAO